MRLVKNVVADVDAVSLGRTAVEAEVAAVRVGTLGVPPAAAGVDARVVLEEMLCVNDSSGRFQYSNEYSQFQITLLR